MDLVSAWSTRSGRSERDVLQGVARRMRHVAAADRSGGDDALAGGGPHRDAEWAALDDERRREGLPAADVALTAAANDEFDEENAAGVNATIALAMIIENGVWFAIHGYQLTEAQSDAVADAVADPEHRAAAEAGHVYHGYRVRVFPPLRDLTSANVTKDAAAPLDEQWRRRIPAFLDADRVLSSPEIIARSNYSPNAVQIQVVPTDDPNVIIVNLPPIAWAAEVFPPTAESAARGFGHAEDAEFPLASTIARRLAHAKRIGCVRVRLFPRDDGMFVDLRATELCMAARSDDDLRAAAAARMGGRGRGKGASEAMQMATQRRGFQSAALVEVLSVTSHFLLACRRFLEGPDFTRIYFDPAADPRGTAAFFETSMEGARPHARHAAMVGAFDATVAKTGDAVAAHVGDRVRFDVGTGRVRLEDPSVFRAITNLSGILAARVAARDGSVTSEDVVADVDAAMAEARVDIVDSDRVRQVLCGTYGMQMEAARVLIRRMVDTLTGSWAGAVGAMHASLVDFAAAKVALTAQQDVYRERLLAMMGEGAPGQQQIFFDGTVDDPTVVVPFARPADWAVVRGAADRGHMRSMWEISDVFGDAGMDAALGAIARVSVQEDLRCVQDVVLRQSGACADGVPSHCRPVPDMGGGLGVLGEGDRSIEIRNASMVRNLLTVSIGGINDAYLETQDIDAAILRLVLPFCKPDSAADDNARAPRGVFFIDAQSTMQMTHLNSPAFGFNADAVAAALGLQADGARALSVAAFAQQSLAAGVPADAALLPAGHAQRDPANRFSPASEGVRLVVAPLHINGGHYGVLFADMTERRICFYDPLYRPSVTKWGAVGQRGGSVRVGRGRGRGGRRFESSAAASSATTAGVKRGRDGDGDGGGGDAPPMPSLAERARRMPRTTSMCYLLNMLLLLEEVHRLQGKAFDAAAWRFGHPPASLPRQGDLESCGVYSLCMIKQLILNEGLGAGARVPAHEVRFYFEQRDIPRIRANIFIKLACMGDAADRDTIQAHAMAIRDDGGSGGLVFFGSRRIRDGRGAARLQRARGRRQANQSKSAAKSRGKTGKRVSSSSGKATAKATEATLTTAQRRALQARAADKGSGVSGTDVMRRWKSPADALPSDWKR